MYYGIAGDILDRLEAQMRGQTQNGTNRREYRKVVVLHFKRAALLYDIKHPAYLEGKVIQTDDEAERSIVMDIAEDGYVDRVTRKMDEVVAECTEMLYPFTKVDVDDYEERDDDFQETEVYKIAMKVPDNFSKTTVDLLEKKIHALIVCKALSDYMSITNVKNPESAANWESKIEALKDEITSTLNATTVRARRTQTPF